MNTLVQHSITSQLSEQSFTIVIIKQKFQANTKLFVMLRSILSTQTVCFRWQHLRHVSICDPGHPIPSQKLLQECVWEQGNSQVSVWSQQLHQLHQEGTFLLQQENLIVAHNLLTELSVWQGTDWLVHIHQINGNPLKQFPRNKA